MLKRTILAIVTLAVIAGCSHKKEQPAPLQVDIHVLFAYDGFCNVGYNDLILKGIERSAEKYGFEYSFLVPESTEEGMEDYRRWCSSPIEAGADKALYIFASNIYEKALANEEHPDPSTGKEILIFETEKELPYAYSFGMSYYGAAYVMSKIYLDTIGLDINFNIIAANPYVWGLDHITDGIEACRAGNGMGSVTHRYLSNHEGEGLNLQELAFLYCYTLYSKGEVFKTIFLPVGGMSNLGVYRFGAEHVAFYWGIDMDDASYATYISRSMYKKMDLAFNDFFDKWLKNETVPRNRFYTLESGRIGLIYPDDIISPKEKVDSLIKEAIIKEKEYFKDKNR